MRQLFTAVNDEGSRAFISESGADTWIKEQPDFDDWIVGKTQVDEKALTEPGGGVRS